MQDSQKLLGQAKKTRGYLDKKSTNFFETWKKRYFLIMNLSLIYYEDETLQIPKKVIPIAEVASIEIRSKCQFQIVTKTRVYQLRAADQPSKELWVASLKIIKNYNSNQQLPSKQVANKNKSLKPSTIITISPLKELPKQIKTTKHISPNQIHSKSNNKTEKFIKNESSIHKKQKQPSMLFDILMSASLKKLAERVNEQKIRKKILFIRSEEQKQFYLIVSNKTIEYCYEDEDLLKEEFIKPYDFNTLYRFKTNKKEHAEGVKVCRCSDITKLINLPEHQLRVEYGLNKVITIDLLFFQLDNKQDINKFIRKLEEIKEIAKEYFNPNKIKINKNIDRILHVYAQQLLTIQQIVKDEFEKCLLVEVGSMKESTFFIKNLQAINQNLHECLNSCEAKSKQNLGFKQEFTKHYHELAFVYLNKMWKHLHKTLNLFELKKFLKVLYQFWKTVSRAIQDDRLRDGAIVIVKILLGKYTEEINSKIQYSSSSKEENILEIIKVQQKELNGQISEFYSNKLLRQFQVDIKLTLYEFAEMPAHEKTVHHFCKFYINICKYLCEKTSETLEKWKMMELILGTCNEIETIKGNLFEQMVYHLSKENKATPHNIKKQLIEDIEAEFNSVQISLIKKLFILSFSAIDRSILGKKFEDLQINLICQQILERILHFNKINKFVLKNLLDSAFQQICFFYYSSVIKCDTSTRKTEFTTEFILKKLTEDLNLIHKSFEKYISKKKILMYLKELGLLRQFIQCESQQIKRVCLMLRSEFGNSFNDVAMTNLINLRSMSVEQKNKLITDCLDIANHSPDMDEMSLQSSRDTQLQNWNQNRSRKSTLTLSIHQFCENQHQVSHALKKCQQSKSGHLLRKKIIKNGGTAERKAFFQLADGQLLEFQYEGAEEAYMRYNLMLVINLFIRPERTYEFVMQYEDCRVQFKTQSTNQCREWVRNIAEELPQNKERSPEKTDQFLIQLAKQPSTISSKHSKINKNMQSTKTDDSPPILSKKDKILKELELIKSIDIEKKLTKEDSGCFSGKFMC